MNEILKVKATLITNENIERSAVHGDVVSQEAVKNGFTVIDVHGSDEVFIMMGGPMTDLFLKAFDFVEI